MSGFRNNEPLQNAFRTGQQPGGSPVIGGDEEQEDDCEDEHDADGSPELPSAEPGENAGYHRRPRFQSSSRA